VIYVGGGNTKSLLALWRDWGLDSILRQAWQAGIVLAGVSAGSICWFKQGITDAVPGEFTALDGLGFLPLSNCPHFDTEPERQPIYRRLIADGAVADGYAADDGVALHFTGGELYGIVSARAGGRARRIERGDGGVRETVLEPVPLADYLPV
jgi:dipeptidase E